MKEITLGKTGITVPQNGFGALPIQRISKEEAVELLRRAWQGGMRFFDTARAYSDSEEKVGEAIREMNRDEIFIATKTMAQTPEAFWKDLETSLSLLGTDYVDIYQFHCANQVFAPNDGTGMYEAMLEAKRQGKIRHIGITTHKLQVARDAIASGLYETLQFPLSYLSSRKESDLVHACVKADMGFIGMKGLAGGLIRNSKAAMAFISQFENAVPIWGVQKPEELEEWLAFFKEMPEMNREISEFIDREREEMAGEFCRGCGYCMPCPAGITINQCARMSLMLRRAPSKAWLNEHWQKEMAKIENCLHCNQCRSKCPYELNTPELLQKNLSDYKKVLRGEVKV
ncbi:MAG: aldo/keto reductase [Erysipelotrichaceae bacterium]|nr:aldo/keto reductase [Erysipelotrichaceae bacterium]